MHTHPFIALQLAMDRQVVHVFIDDHLGQQAFPGHTFLHHPTGQGSGDHRAVPVPQRSGIFGPDVLLYVQFRGNIVQDLGDVVPNLLQPAHILVRLEDNRLPAQVVGKLHPAGMGFGFGRGDLHPGTDVFDFGSAADAALRNGFRIQIQGQLQLGFRHARRRDKPLPPRTKYHLAELVQLKGNNSNLFS